MKTVTHEPEPQTDAQVQHAQVVQAQAIARAASRYVEALGAGMRPASARRWPRYLAMKERLGEPPITLQEAVEQCEQARTLAAP